jgi:hypothetical protein
MRDIADDLGIIEVSPLYTFTIDRIVHARCGEGL